MRIRCAIRVVDLSSGLYEFRFDLRIVLIDTSRVVSYRAWIVIINFVRDIIFVKGDWYPDQPNILVIGSKFFLCVKNIPCFPSAFSSLLIGLLPSNIKPPAETGLNALARFVALPLSESMISIYCGATNLLHHFCLALSQSCH